MTPEGRVKAKVKRALVALRNDGFNTKVYWFMPVQMGMGAPALDFFCSINGKFVAIETKAKGKKLTGRQWATAEAIHDGGGLIFIIDPDTNIDDIMSRIRHACQS